MYDTRKEIASLIATSLLDNKEQLQHRFQVITPNIAYFVVDDLLPKSLVLKIYRSFPKIHQTVKKNTIRENKFVGYQMNTFDNLLEEVIYAFQEPIVVQAIAEICVIQGLQPDEYLYAGGISMMKQHNFLNPHLDNSHDKDVDKWRVLNLLYYVTPDWELSDGGNLELWPDGVKRKQTTIESRCNRLVVMATHQSSWHSVSKVISDKVRCCVSNYYFSETPLQKSDRFHVTTFRGRPEEPSKDMILRVDSFIRSSLRKIFKKGIRENKHQYRK